MKLVAYEKNHHSHILNYQLSEEQNQYTMKPQDCLPLAREDNNRHNTLVFNEKDQLVTFFVLHEKDGVTPYSERENVILLRAFSTDYRYQGKGYAKQALQLLPDYVKQHFPHIREILLAVNEANLAAQALYKKCGYIDAGERRIGPKGVLLLMSYHFPNV